MAVTRIFVAQSLAPQSDIVLDDAPSNHLLRVLRHKPGQALILFNGQGGEYFATLAGQQGKRALVSVQEFTDIDRESPLTLELATALLGGSRMDLIIQKAVELGVSVISPVLSSRVEAKIPANRLESRLTHWQNVIISACEQCGRNRLATINAPALLGTWLHNVSAERKLAGDPQGLAFSSLVTKNNPSSVSVLIGPEGGLTDVEQEQLQQQQFHLVSFGPRILRAETAAISAATMVQGMWGDLHGV